MSSSRPKPSAICLLALEILLCIAIYLLCVCIRRRDRHWLPYRTTVQASVVVPSAPRGLDPSVVASFPVIPYGTLANSNNQLECAVCLSAFQGDDTLRFIPTCRHVFHPACVDPWLALHATCPYCRANLSPSGEVVVLVTVTNEVPGGRTEPAPARDGVADDGRYTLRLSDAALRNIVPESSSRLAGESCPPMGPRGAGEDHDEKPIQRVNSLT